MSSSQFNKIKASIANKDRVRGLSESAFFLPRFSDIQVLAELLIVANLMGLFLTIVPITDLQQFSLSVLGQTLFFVNWVTISFAVLADSLRSQLARLPRRWAVLTAVGLFDLTVAACTLGAALVLSSIHVMSWNTTIFLQALCHHLILGTLIAWLMMHYLYVREQLVLQHQSELMARVQVLQLRMRPHFLFNAMNTLLDLVETGSPKAPKVIEDMASLFRASLNANGEVSLLDEIRLCQRYLDIEKIRLGDRLQVDWRIPDDDTLYDCMIPAMTLQPLLENAVFHGVESCAVPSMISILVECSHDEVQIIVTNAFQKSVTGRRGNKIALGNIAERLRMYYGPQSRLITHQSEGVYTVYLSYPFDMDA